MHTPNQRPFLKWAGGKYSSLKYLLSTFPIAPRLIEPFAGSGCVFINTDYPDYLLGEVNSDLVNVFQILQQEGQDFIEYCRTFFCAANNDKMRYYELRDEFNQCSDSRQRAALFIYFNRHGYNGLCRYNKKGGLNVPFGYYIKPYFPETEMQSFYLKCQGATFIQGDYQQTFSAARPGDLIYCDPPYVPLSSTASFTSYSRNKFKEHDQITLAQLAMEYAKKGVTVIISNHDTEFTRHHYREATTIQSFPIARLISCNTGSRKPVNELLAVFQKET